MENGRLRDIVLVIIMLAIFVLGLFIMRLLDGFFNRYYKRYSREGEDRVILRDRTGLRR